MEYVELKGPPPPELVLKFRCNQYRSLPRSGGILDQPAGLLDRMDTLYDVWQIWKLWIDRKPGHEKEWIDAHPDDWPMVLKIMELLHG